MRDLPVFQQPWSYETDMLATQLRQAAWGNDELLHPDLRDGKRDDAHPLWGQCYILSEAYKYISDRNLKSCTVDHEGGTHWYLVDKDNGEIVDLTVEQFDTEPDYEAGRGRGFPSKGDVSNRAAELIEQADWP